MRFLVFAIRFFSNGERVFLFQRLVAVPGRRVYPNVDAATLSGIELQRGMRRPSVWIGQRVKRRITYISPTRIQAANRRTSFSASSGTLSLHSSTANGQRG
jgi:hypothetical protein